MANPFTRLAAKLRDYAEKTEPEDDNNGFRATARIQYLTRLQADIAREIDRELIRAHGQGVSWVSIGAALGSTKQAAQYRHRKAVERQARRPVKRV